ncbi:MAG TPA: hypothetical protein VNM14_24375 [Planctomycetota bacterium]|jgi:hypothetical protein|nr:hypothetical protein [Planctomycetota bacterium]
MRRLWARKSALLLLLVLSACSFGDRRVHLRLDRPLGEPALPRGISILLEPPEDGRPEPHSVVGDVRSGVGVKTAEIVTDDNVRDWVRDTMAQELRHAGFLTAPAGNLGQALRISTTIRALSCREGIGFGAWATLEIRLHADYGTILEKTYSWEDQHLLVTDRSNDEAVDSLHACLKALVSMFLQDLETIVERSPD